MRAPAVLAGSVLACALWSSPAAAATTRATTPGADRVLIVAYPGLTWAGVAAARPPALSGLLARSAVASASVQTAADRTTQADGYLTIGAGNRAGVGGVARTSLVARPDPAGFVVPGAAAVRDHNADLLYGAEPGALGSALAAAGHTAAVVGAGNAALAVMDGAGRGRGDVGPDLAALDPTRVVTAFAGEWRPGAAVLVQLGSPDASDAVLQGLLDEVDLERDLVLVVSPSAPRDRAELTLFAMAGAGVAPGRARSATTRREGYVTLPDIAPTVLSALGVPRPDAMTGTPITAVAGRPADASTIAARAERDARSVFRERTVVAVSVAFLVLQLVVYAAAAWRFRHPRWRPVLAAGLLAVLAFPALTFLSGLVAFDRLGSAGYVAVLTGGALAIGGGAAWARRLVGTRLLVPLVLAGVTWVLMVVDGVLGGRLQLDTPFGYSPITAARFAGMGNLGFALLLVTAIVVATGAWPVWPGVGLRPASRPASAPRALLALAALGFAVSVLVDGLPAFGADLGGVLALLPALAVTWLLLAGVRVGATKLAAVVGVAVVAAVAFAAYDLSGPEERRTHLGRFARQLLDGDGGVVIERKISSNLAVLANVGVIVAVVVGGVALLAAWRSAHFRRLRSDVPGVQAAVIGSVVGAVLGLAVNDSGIVVPGMMLAVLVPWFALVAFELDP